jgi:hypothetical protein
LEKISTITLSGARFSFLRSRMDEKPRRDWFKFWTHGFFGALAGMLLGLRAWSTSDHASSTSWWPGFFYVTCGALLTGLIAGLLSDSGWDEGR